MPTVNIPVGSTAKCTETGKMFTIERQGSTFNCAIDRNGGHVSDEGVDVRERRELRDRSRSFTCYLSADMKHATGWKGNVLGTVTWYKRVSLSRWSYTHGTYMYAVNVRDVHGGMWYGRGSGGICINLQPMKG